MLRPPHRGAMTKPAGPHEFSVVIDAPLTEVWRILATRFDQIDEWASGIPRSWPAEVDGHTRAPVPGRVCAADIRGFGDIVETIVDYGEDPFHFTYRASGMPAWLGSASNTWNAEPIDDSSTLVYFEPELVPTGRIGRLLLPLLMRMGRRLARETLDDLKVFAESGRPSLRKRKADTVDA
jgi:polyketide cyclase/dehydrase/lipid transport protein